MSQRVRYRRGYKNQLVKEFSISTSIRPDKDISLDFLSLDINGRLIVQPGYAWDGATGLPVFLAKTRFFKWIVRGALIHDVIYQLIRYELISRDYKAVADEMLRVCCIEDGCWIWIADIVYEFVDRFGYRHIHPDGIRPILTAP